MKFTQTLDVLQYLTQLQRRIAHTVADIDGQQFVADAWQKSESEPLQGEGVTMLLENGQLMERAGIGFSHVRGPRLPSSATQHRPELSGAPFEAMGVSLVFHPRNPYVPTVHMNVRLLWATPPQGAPVCWLGGGMDLTPYYGFEEDARHFHQTCHDALAPFGPDLYPRFKAWCDQYFFLKHRQEPRGVGGIFFDDFSEFEMPINVAMLKSVGNALLEAYVPIVKRRQHMPYGPRERAHQLNRRGRYAEFNLVWDRGTHFGLQSGGRTESILMSMPPLASWGYQVQPEPGSAEAELTEKYLIAKDWLGCCTTADAPVAV
jgi:coproporphyrinogen III oxidase